MHILGLTALMRNASFAAYLLLLSCGVGALADQNVLAPESTREGPFDKAFDRFVEETLATLHVPGISIAVVDRERTYSKVYMNKTHPVVS